MRTFLAIATVILSGYLLLVVEARQCDNSTEYTCANKRCIALELYNNTVNDCWDNSDEATVPCRRPLFSCRNNRCALMSWILDGNDDCLDGTDEAKLIGTNCTSAVNCCFCDVYVPHSDCVAGVCRCNTGYYPNSLGTQCIARVIGEQCGSDVDCSVVNGSLCSSDGYCTCLPGFTTALDTYKCLPRQLDDSCTVDNDCTPTVPNSRCDVTNMTCVCDVIRGFRRTENNTCDIPRVTVTTTILTTTTTTRAPTTIAAATTSSPTTTTTTTESLTTNFSELTTTISVDTTITDIHDVIGCRNDTDCSSDGSSICLNATCHCVSGFVPNNISADDVITCRRRKLFDDPDVPPCTLQTDCDDVIPFSDCDVATGSCVCRTGYAPGVHACAQIGESCSTNADCAEAIPNSYCETGSGNRRINRCECDVGHASEANGTSCTRRAIGGNCWSTQDCSDRVPGSHCAVNFRCECVSGWYPVAADDDSNNITCVKRKIGDSSICHVTSDCSDAIPQSECVDDACACRSGYRPDTSGHVCVLRLVFETACARNEDCEAFFPNSSCDLITGFCECATAFKLHDNLTRCSRLRLGDNCRHNEDCHMSTVDSRCDELARRCTCRPGYRPSDDDDPSSGSSSPACRRRLIGESCASTSDCSALPFAMCDGPEPETAVCACASGYGTPVARNDECRRRKIGDEDVRCDTNIDCSASVEHGICSGTNGICGCRPGFMDLDNGTLCVLRELGDPCSTDEDCLEAMEHTVCQLEFTGSAESAAVKWNGICSCDEGYRANDSSSCRLYYLDDNCSSTFECNYSVEYSLCHGGICCCVSGYLPIKDELSLPAGTCKRRVIGDPCEVPSDCTDAVTFTECVTVTSVNSTGAICRCDEEHMTAENGTVCAIRPTLAPYIPVVEPMWSECNVTESRIRNSSVAFSSQTNSTPTELDLHQQEEQISECRRLVNEECVKSPVAVSPSSGRCQCRGGYARRNTSESCYRARGFEVRLNCTWIAGRWELLPLEYNWNIATSFNSSNSSSAVDAQYWKLYTGRLQHSGLDVIFGGSSVTSSDYLSNTVVYFADGNPGLIVSMAVYLDFNTTLEVSHLQQTFHDYINGSEGEIGTSRLYIAEPFNESLYVGDLDECSERSMVGSLNDCDPNASCDNHPGYFDCVCNLQYKDETVDRTYDGRYCVAIDAEKVQQEIEQTFKNAGCSDGVCQTQWDVVLIVTSSVFSVLLLLLTVELIWRTRQLRRYVRMKQRRKSAGLLSDSKHKGHVPTKTISGAANRRYSKPAVMSTAVSFRPGAPGPAAAKRSCNKSPRLSLPAASSRNGRAVTLATRLQRHNNEELDRLLGSDDAQRHLTSGEENEGHNQHNKKPEQQQQQQQQQQHVRFNDSPQLIDLS